MTRALIVLLCSACTLDAGTGFATLSEATVEARLEGGSTQATDLGYQVTFTRFELVVDHVVLEEQTGVERESAGHAHDEEEPSEAEGASSYVPIAEVHIDAAVDVLGGETVASDEVEPSAELPLATVSRVSVQITALRIEATVQDAGSISMDVPVSGMLSAAAPLAIDRDGPRLIDLEVTIPVPDGLFDGIDFATATADPDETAHRILETAMSVSFGAQP